MSERPAASSPYSRRSSDSLWRSLQDVLLHPVAFFRQLPDRSGRTWLWAGLLILLLVGISGVRQVMPQGDDMAFSDQLVTGLLSAGPVLLAWVGLMLVLSLIPMLRGSAPSFALNWRVAVWASTPFVLLALAQIGYIALGETIAGPGITPVLPEIPGYDDLDPATQTLLESAASQITLFGLWQVILLVIAGRNSLNGSWWAVLLTLLVWVGLALWLPGVVEILSNPPPPDSTPALMARCGCFL